ncbi:hypothetical protein MES4922_30222 [Mesorhizobium ventifaucium]|uniref:Uncharacterized protein n=1 Tax=Mesorhizobium ventifaucium TaxID=666020 RepID=A0ABN8JXQ8_9HYPH|nr:hypothetical protein MES4922_30222 [Mesorhizobium ventifaucium]
MEAAKGSCLTSSQAIAASVTNPFMVTAAFTIFFELELFFIRILALPNGCADLLAGWLGPHPVKPALGETLTFVQCTIYYLHCTTRPGTRPRPPLKDNCQGIA